MKIIYKIIQAAYSELLNFVSFTKSKYSFKNKIRIFLTWIKINIKFIFLVKLLRLSIKKENILGYKINAFDYDAIRFLFEEIFVKAQYFIELKNKKPVIFDCGANIGVATIFFKWMYPESEIFAFEPDKNTFELLKNNIIQNRLKNINLFNSALADKEGKIDFFIDSSKQGSLTMSENFNRISANRKIEVSAVCLSRFIREKFIEKIDLIKMDIEGSEKKAMEDLYRNNQLDKISNFIVEYHHRVARQKSALGEFLLIFEKNNFEYQINTDGSLAGFAEKFQNILIYVSRKINSI
jgi:FkbM family methyltransferase